MDAHVTRAVDIILVPIALVKGTRQEEEEEREAVLVRIEMAEINPEPLWQPGNTPTR